MEELCGYRVQRSLATGGDGEVLLARDGSGRSVVVRVIGAADDGAVTSEILAMSAVDSPHVLPLADFAVLDDGRVLLVTPVLDGGTLGALLARRSHLSAGECVTVLVSAARGVAALHAAGWAHGSIGAAAIRFSRRGVPVLTGLRRAAPLSVEGRALDVAALRALVRAVLERSPEAAPLLDALETAPTPRLLEETLLGFAGPAPVDLAESPPEPARAPAPEWAALLSGNAREAEPARRPLAPWAAHLLQVEGLHLLRETAERAVASAREVRPRVWAAAAAAALALLTAVVVVPATGATPASGVAHGGDAPQRSVELQNTAAGEGDDGQAAPGQEVHRQGEEQSRRQGAEESRTVPPDAEPDPTGDAQRAAGAQDAEEAAGGDSEDPLAAATALLALRQRCFESVSADCLSGADQDGSVALADDLAILERLRTGAVVPSPPQLGEAPSVQRTGDSAIIAGTGVSVLLVRGESGWRIRDLFDAPVPAG